jgi:excisionase family DNA binding protein
MTTGDIARVLMICQRTAAKMMDSGEIVSWKLPNSSHRRATRESVMDYAKKHGIPIHDPAFPDILTREQVARTVDMPLKTVVRWIEQGRLREVSNRWQYGIHRDDLLDFCNANGIRMKATD